ncbi:unnamed protein product [Porites lobata]|uniref:Uncharacterized protein n=1 Tax=Porites lobata TaxID=104759 RepID=A0ABN8QG19_9CNID|nr:unnamed protein product [Porites lobata]
MTAQKRIYHTKTMCKPCLDASKTRDAQKVEEFITTLEKSLPQPLYWKSPRKIELLQGCSQWISHAKLRQEEKQICRLSQKKKTAPLNFATGEIIQDRAQQMERWVEHYSELSARENMVSLEALNATDCLLWIMNLLKWS